MIQAPAATATSDTTTPATADRARQRDPGPAGDHSTHNRAYSATRSATHPPTINPSPLFTPHRPRERPPATTTLPVGTPPRRNQDQRSGGKSIWIRGE